MSKTSHRCIIHEMKISVIIIVAIILFIFASAFAGQVFGQTNKQTQSVRELMLVPPDSAEAERVRIWIPQEHTNRCRVVIDILDSSGQVIRHLVNQLLSQGYYNLYWDKKDDGGKYVDSGIYRFSVNDCGGNKHGEVEAKFKKWEILSRIMPFDTARAGRVDIDLLADSALVSIVIKFRTGKIADAPITDSLFMSGHHRFNWSPAPLTRPGRYFMTIRVGDFEKTYQFMYRRKKK